MHIVAERQKQTTPVRDAIAHFAWSELAVIEPALLPLERQAAAGGDWLAWEQVKRGFQYLAGWDARRRELRTAAAYDCVYHHLLAVFERRAAK